MPDQAEYIKALKKQIREILDDEEQGFLFIHFDQKDRLRVNSTSDSLLDQAYVLCLGLLKTLSAISDISDEGRWNVTKN